MAGAHEGLSMFASVRTFEPLELSVPALPLICRFPRTIA
jgi:hypothetical protein